MHPALRCHTIHTSRHTQRANTNAPKHTLTTAGNAFTAGSGAAVEAALVKAYPGLGITAADVGTYTPSGTC